MIYKIEFDDNNDPIWLSSQLLDRSHEKKRMGTLDSVESLSHGLFSGEATMSYKTVTGGDKPKVIPKISCVISSPLSDKNATVNLLNVTGLSGEYIYNNFVEENSIIKPIGLISHATQKPSTVTQMPIMVFGEFLVFLEQNTT